MVGLRGISIPEGVANRGVTLRELLLVVGLFKKLLILVVEEPDKREILLENVRQVERRLVNHG